MLLSHLSCRREEVFEETHSRKGIGALKPRTAGSRDRTSSRTKSLGRMSLCTKWRSARSVCPQRPPFSTKGTLMGDRSCSQFWSLCQVGELVFSAGDTLDTKKVDSPFPRECCWRWKERQQNFGHWGGLRLLITEYKMKIMLLRCSGCIPPERTDESLSLHVQTMLKARCRLA